MDAVVTRRPAAGLAGRRHGIPMHFAGGHGGLTQRPQGERGRDDPIAAPRVLHQGQREAQQGADQASLSVALQLARQHEQAEVGRGPGDSVHGAAPRGQAGAYRLTEWGCEQVIRPWQRPGVGA